MITEGTAQVSYVPSVGDSTTGYLLRGVLDPVAQATLPTTTLSGTNKPVCVTGGRIYAGTNTGGVLTCP